MSVRRLAEDSVQPKSFAFNRTFAAQAKVWVKKYPKGREQSAVIPLLMLAQEQEGWVTKSAIETIADMLGMPYIRALEVATFYTQFQLKPVGTRAHVQVCGTTPCMLRGSEALMDVCRAKIHPEPFHTNASGTLSWEEVECQGACVNAPMVMIFKDTFEDLTPERLAYIIDRFDAGRPGDIVPGPQIDRIYSAPVGGPTTLKEDPTAKKPKVTAKAGSNANANRAAKSPAPTQAAKPKGGNEGALTTSRPVAPPEKLAEANAAAGGKKATAAKATAADAPATTASATATKGAAAKSPASKASATAAKSVSAPAAKSAAKAAAPVAKAEPKTVAKAAAKPAAKAEAKPVASKPQPVAALAATAAAKPVAAKAKPAAASPKAAPAAKAEAAPSLADKNRPAAVKKPAKPDDLKMISGVGPKLEGVLNGLGIYTFAQVASWKKAERDWVDTYLKFKGRIERDDWVKQAKALAKGGRDEYVRVFGKEPR